MLSLRTPCTPATGSGLSRHICAARSICHRASGPKHVCRANPYQSMERVSQFSQLISEPERDAIEFQSRRILDASAAPAGAAPRGAGAPAVRPPGLIKQLVYKPENVKEEFGGPWFQGFLDVLYPFSPEDSPPLCDLKLAVITLQPGEVVPKHSHSIHIIYMTAVGGATIELGDGTSFDVKAGDVYFLPEGTVYGMRTGPAGAVGIHLYYKCTKPNLNLF